VTLSLADILHINGGGVANAVNTTPFTVSLAAGDTTSTGSTVLVICQGGGSQGAALPGSGWARVGSFQLLGSTQRFDVFRRGPNEGLVAGETSWSFTPSSPSVQPINWAVLEIANIDADFPVDVAPTSNGVANATTGTTTLTPSTPAVGISLTSTYDGLSFVVHGSVRDDSSLTATTWSGHTNGFTEVWEGATSGGTPTTLDFALDMSISVLPVQALGTYTCTATNSATMTTTSPTNIGAAFGFTLSALGAHRAADLWMIDGAEQGTVSGAATGTVGYRLVDTLSGDVTAVAAAARSGNYGWRTAGTASVGAYRELIGAGSGNFNTTRIGSRPVLRRCFRFPTLPAADTTFWTLVLTNGTDTVTLRYITASGKLGLKINAGTEQVSDQPITANQWFAVDLLGDFRATAGSMNWQVAYNADNPAASGVAQTAAAGTINGTSIINTYRIGQTTAGVFELHDDDGVGSGTPAHYPLGDHRIVPVKVDPAGTIDFPAGTAAAFGVMTNNGTVSAFNATNARNAIDDIPPDLSGTRDALVGVTGSTSDTVRVPMDTYNAANNGVSFRGVRLIMPWWAASTAACTGTVFVHNGVDALYLLASSVSPGVTSTSIPSWITGIVRQSAGRIDWTQAKIDGLNVQLQFPDATPDHGPDAILMEIAVKSGAPRTLSGDVASVVVDPDTEGIVSITTVAPVGDVDTTLYYEVNGSPTTVAVPAGTTHVEPIGAPDAPTVNYIALYPPPEPDPVE
jgi:hypothetical protein